jgi:DNA-directed RNA polymerase
MQTFTPIEYLMLDIASNYGLDKETWDARLDWFKTVEGIITQADDLNKSPIFRALNKEAAEPALFFTGCLAYRKAIKGESITYPISLDATASGAQLLAVLIGCEKSGRLCNVVDTGNREDLYTNVYNLMRDILASGDFGYVEGDDAVVDGTGGITRSDAKAAVMTLTA